MRGWLMPLVLLAVGLAGCTDEEGVPVPAADIGAQGQWRAGYQETVDFVCGASARFDAGAQGQGHLVITLQDGAGQTVGSLMVKDQSQQGVDKQVSGTAGTWTLTAEVRDYDWGTMYGYSYDMGFDFQGQYGAAVFC